MKLCNCYVRYLSELDRFTLRNGAHDPLCPVYRRSGDPVDRAKDDAYRAMATIGRPQTYAVETVKRPDLFGHVHDTYATETELNGFKPTQGALI